MIPLLHHEAPGDPTLLRWVQDRLDHLIGLEAEAIVLAIGLLLLAIPVGILAAYVWQRRKPPTRSP